MDPELARVVKARPNLGRRDGPAAERPGGNKNAQSGRRGDWACTAAISRRLPPVTISALAEMVLAGNRR